MGSGQFPRDDEVFKIYPLSGGIQVVSVWKTGFVVLFPSADAASARLTIRCDLREFAFEGERRGDVFLFLAPPEDEKPTGDEQYDLFFSREALDRLGRWWEDGYYSYTAEFYDESGVLLENVAG